ncbi:MAG: DUF1232 domain-containing protein [Selenomonadaceae bacterium]|nr:DUF1232 domain-containing protein [Selenomonadaceae bacterium]
MTTNDTAKYAGDYSESSFFDKITSTIKSAGLTLIYEALQLFYVTENPNCPMRIKAAIFAALGYFISPLDVVPDFTPFVGYSDDAGAIAIALGLAQMYIDDEVKQKARNKICDIFGKGVLRDLD